MENTTSNHSLSINRTSDGSYPRNDTESVARVIISEGIEMVAIIGNSIVITAFAKCKNLRRVGNIFSLNMAISDLQSGLFTNFVLISIVNSSFQEDFAGCKFLICYPVVLAMASALSLLCSTIVRLIYVMHPLRYSMIVTRSRVVVTLVCIWAMSLIIGFAPLFTPVKRRRGPSSFLFRVCSGTVEGTLMYYGLLIVGIMVPIASVICLIYFYLGVVARKLARPLVVLGNSQSTSLSSKTTGLSKSVKAFLSISVTMFICWMPLSILIFICHLVPKDERPLAFLTTTTFAISSPAINPWIFTLKNTEFKETIETFIVQCTKRVKRSRKTFPAQTITSEVTAGVS